MGQSVTRPFRIARPNDHISSRVGLIRRWPDVCREDEPLSPADMSTPLTRALTQARADWLAGDAAAWVCYTACVRQLDALRRAVYRPKTTRRPARPRIRA